MYTSHSVLFASFYSSNNSILASSVVTGALLFCHQSQDECPEELVQNVQTHYELDVSDSQVYHNSIHAIHSI